MTTIINPWHNQRSAYSPAQFVYRGNALFTHRDVEVFRNDAGSYDYAIGGMAITQRHGFRKEVAPLVIDGILDGKDLEQHHWVCDRVAAHLRSLGFTPFSYSDASREEAMAYTRL